MTYIYTEQLKKPDTSRKVQVLGLNVNANFTYRTSKSIFEQNLFINTKHDVKTSKKAFLSILFQKCMSKAIFYEYFHVCKTNSCTDKSAF